MDERRRGLLIPHGKGDRRREVGWTPGTLCPGQPDGWLHLRDRRACSHRARGAAPPRCRDWGRVALNQLHHAHAIELLHEGIPLPRMQRQLRHAYLSTTVN